MTECGSDFIKGVTFLSLTGDGNFNDLVGQVSCRVWWSAVPVVQLVIDNHTAASELLSKVSITQINTGHNVLLWPACVDGFSTESTCPQRYVNQINKPPPPQEELPITLIEQCETEQTFREIRVMWAALRTAAGPLAVFLSGFNSVKSNWTWTVSAPCPETRDQESRALPHGPVSAVQQHCKESVMWCHFRWATTGKPEDFLTTLWFYFTL